MRVNYGGELESLVHAIVEGGSKQQLRDILMAEVSRDLLMAEVSTAGTSSWLRLVGTFSWLRLVRGPPHG